MDMMQDSRNPSILLRLTPRERHVVNGVMRAQTVKEIAKDLGISYETAKDALKNVYLKAEVHSARALMLKILDYRQPRQDWPVEALNYFSTAFPSREAVWSEVRRLVQEACPGAAIWVAMLEENRRVMLFGNLTARVDLAPAAFQALSSRQVWVGKSEALFGGQIFPPLCPCIAAPFQFEGDEMFLVVVRPQRALAFSETEVSSVRLIALLTEAKSRAGAAAAAFAGQRLARASIA